MTRVPQIPPRELGPPERPVVHAEPVMGTVVSFTVWGGTASTKRVWSAVYEACRLLEHLDALLSTWRPDSPMSRLRRGDLSLAHAPPEILEVVAHCEEAKAVSGGWFDPWAMPGGVDPTGLAKGWAIGQALEVLRSAGVEAALVNGGGDLACFGEPGPGQRWRIGIRHPWLTDALAGVVQLDQALATSGTYERGAHLIDPHTGRAAFAAVSASVSGPTLALADGLATALAVGGDEVLALVRELDNYEAYLIRRDGTEASTDGMAFVWGKSETSQSASVTRRVAPMVDRGVMSSEYGGAGSTPSGLWR
jgi:thiamine biosynthesis lipoprotein